jgi:hypothetical protein
MRVLKESVETGFNLAIWGLGFESRAISAFDQIACNSCHNVVFGYTSNTNVLHYQTNKSVYESQSCKIYECEDSDIIAHLRAEFETNGYTVPINVYLEISVMSRHRLASIMTFLLEHLSEGSNLTVSYSLSSYVEPPEEPTPIRTLGEICPDLCGELGDLNLPTAVIFGLGYEKSKALGVSNYLDSSIVFALIPESPNTEFEGAVRANNDDFLEILPEDHISTYKVMSPYSTYVDLKSLILSLIDESRPLLIPLGPKILSALSVIIGIELGIPVWRVSSDHLEIPTERPCSGNRVAFTIRV